MAKKMTKTLNMIEKIAKGINTSKRKDQTLLKMMPTEDKKVKTLSLQSGSWSSKEPWFVVDEKQKLHALIPVESLVKLVESFKQMEEEALMTNLERSILQHLPIDFQDVWTVAMEEIEKQHKANIDFERLIQKIKKEHPNLFLDLKDLYLPEGFNLAQSFE